MGGWCEAPICVIVKVMNVHFAIRTYVVGRVNVEFSDLCLCLRLI